ncbi:MAG: hypothetical protein QGG36_15825 [Pirellulaceae bacterium]|jgi:hypothetical protein|nr:hypothetical protein [Pirellulaceae bacterium]
MNKTTGLGLETPEDPSKGKTTGLETRPTTCDYPLQWVLDTLVDDLGALAAAHDQGRLRPIPPQAA